MPGKRAKLSEAEIADLNYQYLPRLSIDNPERYLQTSARRSARARRKLECEIGIAYGDSPGQLLDIFPGRHGNGPVHVFIHGGYWRSPDVTRSLYSHVALPSIDAGATVVLPDYDLCPAVRVSDIAAQIRAMMVWVYRNIRRFNGDRQRIFVSGHSVGGQLAGMLLSTDWLQYRLPADLIKGTLLLSGLFDIEPHRHTALQADIRLGIREARAMSPLMLAPRCRAASILAVGELEPDLFHWQSLQYAAHLRKHRIRAEYVSTPGDNHLTITDRLGRARDPLTRALISRMFDG